MKVSYDPTRLPAEVRDALGELRRRIQVYVWIEGLALLAMIVAAVFWVGLLLDWFLEPSATIRGWALIVVGAALALVVYRAIVGRLATPLEDDSLALLLEKHDRRLGDHVATAVSLVAQQDLSDQYHPQLVSQTVAAAATAVRDAEVGRLFDYRPLRIRCAGAVLAVLSVAMFGVLATETFTFWIDRLALSEETWPRRTRLEVLGFERDDSGERVQTIARDDDFELAVRADLTGEHVAPDRVTIRFYLPDGRRGRDFLTRIGTADPERDEFQPYRYTFQDVRSDLLLDIRGGDDRVDDLRLRVVDRPELTSIKVDCTFPEYLQRPPQSLSATSGVRVPVGTNLVVRAGASKRIVETTAESRQRDQSTSTSYADRPVEEIRIDYGRLETDDTLEIGLHDIDGIASRRPYRLSLTATPDELPQIAVTLSGIGSAITPQARIPFVGELTDDYGLKDAWFECSVDGDPPRRRPVEGDPDGRTRLEEIGSFDLRGSASTAGESAAGESAVAVEPGQKLTLAVAASDHCDLDQAPRVGTSQRYVLDVVTPAELLLMIEHRELAYRQGFEAIYEKVTDTRAMLARVDFSDVAGERDESVGSDPAGDADSSQRSLALRRLRVAGAGQNITQAADEILNVAEGFENLHDQLINNRIENRELQDRLKKEIADPLRKISQEQMPELESQLREVQDAVADAEVGSARLAASITLTDAVLADMEYVLERMLELETYNEVLALLRGIISDQGELNERTQERRQQGLRSLLED